MSKIPISVDPSLPLQGVVGVVGGDLEPGERRRLLARLRGRLGGVEVRADLFPTDRDAIACLEEAREVAPVLFTVRNSREGGKFGGTEDERLAIYGRAIERGAALVDAEWGTPASAELSRRRAPLLVSHHDFQGTLGLRDLERLGREMDALSCSGIKVVPTARRPSEALDVLEWIGARAPRDRPRVAFAMGDAGFFSRVLAIAHGSPFTYASLGAPVASGQVSAEEMLDVYRPAGLSAGTRTFAAVGAPGDAQLAPHIHNPALRERGIDAVWLPVPLNDFSELADVLSRLPVDGVSVASPYEEDAFRAAETCDAAARTAGAATLLQVKRGDDGSVKLRAIGGAAGILEALRRRIPDLRGIPAAVIGDGGAARVAAGALLAAGAHPTLYGKDEAAATRCASALGLSGRPVGALEPGAARIVIHAMRLEPGEPSPIPREALRPGAIALDAAGGLRPSPFLEEARERGAIAIGMEEVLTDRAVGEFRLLAGREAPREELEENLRRGLEARGWRLEP